jgi:carboxyl-terminal processing protease
MKAETVFLFLVAAAALLLPQPSSAAVEPQRYYGKIARRLGDMLPKYHVSQRPLDDEISRRAWTNLVTYYDFDHSVFLQSDLDRFARRLTTIDDEVRAGDVSFGFEVYNLYVERLRERMDFATNLLKAAKWDFSRDESYRIRRKDAPWPKTHAEAEEHWRRRMKNEVLVQLVNRKLDEEEAAAKSSSSANAPAAGKAGSTGDHVPVAAQPVAGGKAADGKDKADTPE